MPLRILTLVVTPILLGLLNLAHPLVLPEVPLYRQISALPQRWFLLHLLQLPLFALLAAGLYMLTDGLQGTAAKISRVAAIVVGVGYVAMNAILGICLGLLVRHGEAAPLAQQDAIAGAVEALWNDRLVGGFSLLTVTAGLAWLLAVLGAAAALRGAGASAGALTFLVVGGFLFGLGHMRPFGPMGMALFVAGTLWLYGRSSTGYPAR